MVILRSVILAAALLAPVLAAADVAMPVEPARLRVIDGDTVALSGVETDFGTVDVAHEESLRLLGYDTPETWRPRCEWEREHGERATAMLQDMIDTGAPMHLVITGERDGRGRWLVRLVIGGYDAAGLLWIAGLARPHEGSGRTAPWCR